MEETKNEVVETAADTNVDNANVAEEKPAAEAIPEELAGLPEDIAREAMQKAGVVQEEDSSENEESEKPADEVSPDSETKTEQDDSILPNQKIPYVRFKQQVDKNRALESELEQLKAKLNTATQVQPAPQAQQAPDNIPMQPQQTSQPQKPVINAEVTAQIEQAIRQEAMRMSGLDEETISSIDYMDDNDQRRQIWNTAQQMARSEIFRKIEAERQRQIEQNRRMIAEHNKNVLAYNRFAQEQMEDPEFESIKSFATNEYFTKLAKDDEGKLYQEAVAGAYARIERNMGSPQDIVLIKRFFTDAKNEYKKSRGGETKNNSIEKKVRQGQAFPRSGEINGSGNDGNVSVDTLARMLETTPFEQIPEEYQRKLLGYE